MHIDRIEEQGIVILAPNGRLDSNTSSFLEDAIDAVGFDDNGSHILVDFSSVEYISSAGLRVVLKAVKERKNGPKTFVTSSMQDHVREVFEISGFDSYVVIHKDKSQAISALT